MPSPILVGVDPERSSGEQVALGCVLARAYAAPLLLVSVYLVRPMTRTLVRKVAHDEADAALQVAADPTASRSRSARWARSRPPRLVRRRGRDRSADADRGLDTSRPYRPRRAGRGTDNLVNGAPCTVAVAPHDVEVRALRRIGAAFEDSAEGHAALREAIAVAAGTGARIEAWTVAAEVDDAQERKRLAEAALTEALARAGAGSRFPAVRPAGLGRRAGRGGRRTLTRRELLDRDACGHGVPLGVAALWCRPRVRLRAARDGRPGSAVDHRIPVDRNGAR